MKKVLFFGLKGCSYSKQAINFLSSMGCDVDVVSMKDRSFCLDEKTKAWSGDLILSFKKKLSHKKLRLDEATKGWLVEGVDSNQIKSEGFYESGFDFYVLDRIELGHETETLIKSL